jgi:hypothetical protein
MTNNIHNVAARGTTFRPLPMSMQGFDAITYGLGSSLFFVTFCVFQVSFLFDRRVHNCFTAMLAIR